MSAVALLAVLLASCSVSAQDELPGPPSPELADPDQHSDASFGTDVSLLLGGGTLLGDWAVPGFHSSLGLRFDAFMGGEADGPRLGLSLFGEQSMGVLPKAAEVVDEQETTFPFEYYQFGALCVLRSDPLVPWGANAGLGFSRMDIAPYYGGTYPLPVLLFEGGARRQLGAVPSPAFLDVGLRLGWSQLRNPSEALEELWTLQLSIGVGAHVR